jgi:hypothetical protein
LALFLAITITLSVAAAAANRTVWEYKAVTGKGFQNQLERAINAGVQIESGYRSSGSYCGMCAADRDATSERELDRRMLAVLAEASKLVIVGEPVDYDAQDQFELAGYRMALNAMMPFHVKVAKVLHGDGAAEGQAINVGVTRDEVEFRFEKGRSFVFFLKPGANRRKGPSEPLTQSEWRVVSDYFGVQPHTGTLEKTVRSSYEKKG